MTQSDDESDRTMFISRPHPQAAAAPDEVVHYLVAVEGAEPGRRIEIGSAPLTIGRDARQSLVFADTEVSRLHARVSIVNGDLVAEDLGSMNGTFVDAVKLTSPHVLREGSILRVGSQFLKYERRSREDVERSKALDRDLLKATKYVFSLLPPPLKEGQVRTEWRFIPSAGLGGDAFGYYWLDPGTFVFYLVDVSGHGVGSAMHSVTVLNVLRQRALPGVDFQKPADVLASLNNRFQMEAHNGMFFTMWYGVYRTAPRTLVYGSAGHHPAYLVPRDRSKAEPIGMPALMIGAMPDVTYSVAETTIPPGSALHLFSDGAFEIVTKTDERWAMSNFLPLLTAPAVPATSDVDRIYRCVREVAKPGPLDDDFSLLIVSFE
ncbi:MAG: PP2C family protein-serine/threonine phosphatase [Vicinamibacterales bacterium]